MTERHIDKAGIKIRNQKSTEAQDWADNLTEEQIESLQRGLSDFKQGNVIPSKDFWNAYGR